MADNNDNIATLSSNIRDGINNRLKDLHTAMPGTIVSFDPENQLATVQPGIKRVFRTLNDDNSVDLNPVDLPLLINVPVIYPRGGGFSITFPVKEGDECLIVFCERAIDTWHRDGGTATPNAKRFHDLSDAVVHVGMSSLQNKIPDYATVDMEIRTDNNSNAIALHDNGDITIFADGDLNIFTSGDCNIDCDNATIQAATNVFIDGPTVTISADTTVTLDATNIDLVGNVNITGTLTNNGKDVGDTHGHTQAPDGNGDAQAPISGVT